MLKKLFQNHRKLIVGVLLVSFVFLVVPITTHAEGGFCDVWLIDGICNVVTSIIFIPLYLSSFFIWLAGILLDFIIDYTIVNIKTNLGGITGINIAWSVIRDLVNISFIFILLYAAVRTILGDGGGLIKKTITGVVMAAILINFSLFFTKVIIDSSNLVTLTFHEAIVTTCAKSGVRATLSKCFMEPLGLSTIFKDDSNGQTLIQGLHGDFAKAAVISIGGTIFILIATFVFLAAAVMFLVRFVTIIFLLIFSPFAVMGSLLPQLSSHSKKWWADITDQALFPPVFMILVWVVLTVISSSGFIAPIGTTSGVFTNLWDGIAANLNATLQLVFNFFIIISLLIGVLTISKGFSKKGGEMGGKFAGTVMGGGLARQTIGRGATRLASSETLKERAANVDGKYSRLNQMSARAALATSQSAAKASFDMRATKTGGYFGKQLGAGSAGGKGGFAQAEKDKEKAKIEQEKKTAELFKVSDLEKDRIENNLSQAQKNVREKIEGAETEVKTSKDAIAVKRAAAIAQAETLVAQKTPEMITAENNLAQAEALANNPDLILRNEAKAKADIHRATVTRLKEQRANTVKTRAEQILDTTAAAEKAALATAEAKLKDAQEGVTTERTALVQAQIESDRVKGVNADEAKNRMTAAEKILKDDKEADISQIDKDLANNVINQVEADRRKAEIQRMMDNGTRMEAAKAKLKATTGKSIYAPDDKKNDSTDVRRQRAYAERLTTAPFVSSKRVGFVGKIKRENLAAALAIRKATKEKTDEQKLADQVKAMAKKSAEDEKKNDKDKDGTPPPPSSPAPSGGGTP